MGHTRNHLLAAILLRYRPFLLKEAQSDVCLFLSFFYK
jgi:hypothetical protein